VRRRYAQWKCVTNGTVLPQCPTVDLRGRIRAGGPRRGKDITRPGGQAFPGRRHREARPHRSAFPGKPTGQVSGRVPDHRDMIVWRTTYLCEVNALNLMERNDD
jgi:hypothetical protein